MIIIDKILDYKFYKNKTLKTNKNSIAYSKNNDKILFVVDGDNFEINTNDFSLIKENNDTIFYIDKNRAYVKLKEYNQIFDIKIDNIKISNKNNNLCIIYKLESDDELTTIEIITYN